MALKTDDCDIRDVHFYMDFGGNGDYYLNLIEYPKDELEVFKSINYRMAMSGGFAKNYPRVKDAFVKLFREMEKAGLNKHPVDDAISTTVL
ncbi:hypothetical protein [Flavobacterium sedimenticola]|uniref:Uncharacterized protein n=1 Tax=Flavobacterium sedimenticola TaxID=3043286 RepID=A0ABT6XMP6_9FLAO|nr:hypothetical protein [Flavobacterium sedimenticola]MDI9256341.1 hypothetical protein [Flavobacterium sedimenticola]